MAVCRELRYKVAKLTHAILIEGGSESERMAKAIALLKEHFSDDPLAEDKLDMGIFEDLEFLEPLEGKKDIIVDQIKDLIELFAQKPFASTGKACIIPCGERMNEHSQNKLLKLLEEPVAGYVMIIMTENAERLFATVRSRCMRIWLGYAKQEDAGVTEDIKKLTNALVYGKGSFAEAGQIFSRYDGSREEAIDFLRSFQIFLRNISVGRFAVPLVDDGTETGKWLGESAAKVQKKHADRMQKGVLFAEKALKDIERGDRVKYAMRGMALSMLARN